MPIDPKTGEQLPYAGEPGAAPDAPPRQQGPSPQDMEATFEELDQILGAAEGEAAPAPEGAPEEMPPEGQRVVGRSASHACHARPHTRRTRQQVG